MPTHGVAGEGRGPARGLATHDRPAIGVDRSVITRLERGDPSVGPALRARACAQLGADFRMQLYPERAAMLYDAAHARIVDRVVRLAGPGWHPRLELELPGRRSVDVCLFGPACIVLVEIETRLHRLEELQRELTAKREALLAQFGRERPAFVVLVLPPTHRNRRIVGDLPGLIGAAFPASSRQLLPALANADVPWPGDGVLWVPSGRAA